MRVCLLLGNRRMVPQQCDQVGVREVETKALDTLGAIRKNITNYKLHISSSGSGSTPSKEAGGPCTLEIVSSRDTVHIQHLATQEETRYLG